MSQIEKEVLQAEYYTMLKKVLVLKIFAIILSTIGFYFTYRLYVTYGFTTDFVNRSLLTIAIPFAYMIFVKVKTDSIRAKMRINFDKLKRLEIANAATSNEKEGFSK